MLGYDFLIGRAVDKAEILEPIQLMRAILHRTPADKGTSSLIHLVSPSVGWKLRAVLDFTAVSL